MKIVQEILFIVIAAFAGFVFYKKIVQIKRNINLGRSERINDNKSKRWKNLLLLAFGQKKMFRNPLIGVLHFFVYAGFIIVNIELLEIVMDGIFGTHRMFAEMMGDFYKMLINVFEILAFIIIVFCAIFLIRRNIIRVKRLSHKDLSGFPKSDANYILIAEIILMLLFLNMNAADTLLQMRSVEPFAAHPTGNFMVSQYLHPFLKNYNDSVLIFMERTCWWLHILGIFAFLNYLPYSKHLHILLAFPNAYFAKLESLGKMTNMPFVQNEVLYAMQPELAPTNLDASETQAAIGFGAKDIKDLSWKNLLDAYACTECGRCTASCPANITGKLLSPRKIMMATRDRMEAIGKQLNKNKNWQGDGKNLLYDYISVEELRACTTCNACVQECPVCINPLDIILQLRRYLVMEESNAPQEWSTMFSNVENNFAPWQFSPDDRDKWMN
jgi:heterodisulfide reductase subunit C